VENLSVIYDRQWDHDHPDQGDDHRAYIAEALKTLTLSFREKLQNQGDEKTVAEHALEVMTTVLGEDNPLTRQYHEDLLSDES